MEAFQRQLARLDAVVTRATACFDTSGTWALDGAQTTASWLAAKCHLPSSHARRLVRRARALRHLPHSEHAWSAGELTVHHVDTLAALCTEVTEDALERDEAMLVDQARTLRFEPFTRALGYWRQLADPDGTEERAERQRTRRDVYLENSFSGMWLGQMTLDPISGAIVSGELERLEQALFEADWKDAHAALGREPTINDLARTSSQRRADALVEMATRSATAPPNGRRPAPLFSVLVGYETLHGRICELAEGIPIAPGSLLPFLDEATIERAVFTPAGRVEVSATARLFSGSTRRAIELRDQRCTHPICDRPAGVCQVDHIIPYALGGPTTQENGRLLCGFHNRLRNQRPPPDG